MRRGQHTFRHDNKEDRYYYSWCLSLFVCPLFILSVFTAIWRIHVFIIVEPVSDS